MKYSPLWLLAVGLLFSAAAFAQQPPLNRNQPQASTPAKTTAVPAGKVAIINTLAFGDKIDEFKRQAQKLEQEFKPQTDELDKLQKKYEDLQKKASDPNIQPDVARKVQEEGLNIEKEIKRKSEDLKDAAAKRQEITLNPLREKVFKFMESYAANHGIVLIFDVGVMYSANTLGTLPYISPSSDITDDFIKEYNKANPVAAAAPATSNR
jgi:Skp family chaperone for outer membrane proteins